MTTLRIPCAISPLGEPLALDYRVRLVDGNGDRALAIHLPTGSPVAGRYTGSVAAAQGHADIDLLPRAELATAGGKPTWWELRIRFGELPGIDTYFLVVPVSAVPLGILDLISAQAAPPDLAADMAARIAALEANQLPAPGTPGRILLDNGTEWVASDELPLG